MQTMENPLSNIKREMKHSFPDIHEVVLWAGYTPLGYMSVAEQDGYQSCHFM